MSRIEKTKLGATLVVGLTAALFASASMHSAAVGAPDTGLQPANEGVMYSTLPLPLPKLTQLGVALRERLGRCCDARDLAMLTIAADTAGDRDNEAYFRQYLNSHRSELIVNAAAARLKDRDSLESDPRYAYGRQFYQRAYSVQFDVMNALLQSHLGEQGFDLESLAHGLSTCQREGNYEGADNRAVFFQLFGAPPGAPEAYVRIVARSAPEASLRQLLTKIGNNTFAECPLIDAPHEQSQLALIAIDELIDLGNKDAALRLLDAIPVHPAYVEGTTIGMNNNFGERAHAIYMIVSSRFRARDPDARQFGRQLAAQTLELMPAADRHDSRVGALNTKMGQTSGVAELTAGLEYLVAVCVLTGDDDVAFKLLREIGRLIQIEDSVVKTYSADLDKEALSKTVAHDIAQSAIAVVSRLGKSGWWSAQNEFIRLLAGSEFAGLYCDDALTKGRTPILEYVKKFAHKSAIDPEITDEQLARATTDPAPWYYILQSGSKLTRIDDTRE